MVFERNPIVDKWKPFEDEIKKMAEEEISTEKPYSLLSDSAHQIEKALMSTMHLKDSVDSCSVIESMGIIASLSYNMRKIEKDNRIDWSRRKEIADDLSTFITEQTKRFGSMCMCTPK